METKSNNTHTFVICAYKDSEFLEECIKSLFKQTLKSNIIIATSTPSEYINNLAKRYNIEVFVNNGEKGIGNDWNFAVSCCKTKYVTVAHQDDVYHEKFLEKTNEFLEKNKKTIITFTRHKEIKNGNIIPLNKNLKVKELMLFPLKFFNKSKLVKRIVFSMGNPVSCPSVTLNTEIVGKKPFRTDMKSNIDWGTWADMIEYKGCFGYIYEYLTYHRVHPGSETSSMIENNGRLKEDYEMFCRFWPKPIAKFLMHFYKEAVKTNDV